MEERPPNSEMCSAALELASLGFYVLPIHSVRAGVCTCGVLACGKNAGKHPVWMGGIFEHGLTDATRTDWAIEQWYRRLPEANVAIRTGKGSGIFVVDIDPDKGGEESWMALQAVHGQAPAEVAVVTGSGGRHLYYEHPGEGHTIVTNVGAFGPDFPGIDIRGDGGYVVAPPSVHLSGTRYSWAANGDPLDGLRPRPAPEWMLAMLTKEADRSPTKTWLLGQPEIPEGNRNDTLFRLGSSMRGRGMSAAAIEAALIEENRTRCSPPLAEREVSTIALSAASQEANAIPASWSGPIAAEAEAQPILESKPKRRKKKSVAGGHPGAYHLTDLGNARRLVDKCGADLRYCALWGKWLVFNGQRWQIDETGGASVYQLAQGVIRDMHEEASAMEFGTDAREALGVWAFGCESRSRLDNMVSIARMLPGIPVTPGELDANRDIVVVDNGTIDLRTGKLGPHRREDLVTLMIELPYEAEAPCARWEQFLIEIFGEDEELLRFVWKAAGYSLSGRDSEQCMFFLYGNGRNGKSTMVGVLYSVLGDYAKSTQAETLMAKRNEGPSNDIARLKDARFVSAVETEEGRRISEALIKQLTGGDPVSCRFLHQEFFEYIPQFKIWMSGNHKPDVRGTDDGFWRRMRLIPFEIQIPPEKKEEGLSERIATLEGKGVLAWLVRGCVAWYREGLGWPKKVEAAVADYRHDHDVVGMFLEQCTSVDASETIQARRLYELYKTWSIEGGERPLTQQRLGRTLKERGERSERKREGYVYLGRSERFDGSDVGARDGLGI